jgi:hypothetical protein
MLRLSKQYTTALIIVFTITVTVVCAVSWRASRAAAIGSYEEETEYWIAEIGRVGGQDAYKEMVERYSSLGAFDAHEYAHVFGGALYQVEGMNGFSACGNAYVWGCVHSFIERAIAEHGLPAIRALNAVCVALPREDVQECQHGLGHGILSHLGVLRLQEALGECEDLGGTYGCASGVFMEYLNGNIHENRPPVAYADAGAYGPCDSVPQKDRLICYRRLPNWWALTFNGNDTQRFAFIEANCLGSERKDEQDACFVGLGYNETSTAEYDPVKGRAICESLRQTDQIANCMYGGALAIFQNNPVRDRAVEMCPSKNVRACISAAERLIGATEDELALPE